MEKLEVGSVVISKMGRDCGELYMVYGIEGQRLTLVNGREKKIDSPKRKNIKHVIVTNQKLSLISDKLKDNKKIFDSEVYSALKNKAENLDENI